MQEENERPDTRADAGGSGDENSRPQEGGEAGTTRFGMEDGDNSDVPATGGVTDGEEASQRSS